MADSFVWIFHAAAVDLVRDPVGPPDVRWFVCSPFHVDRVEQVRVRHVEPARGDTMGE
jgi:hypothetical protein